jgi:hypothetical protein
MLSSRWLHAEVSCDGLFRTEGRHQAESANRVVGADPAAPAMVVGQGLTTSAAGFRNAAIVDGEVTLCAMSAVAIETKEAAN